MSRPICPTRPLRLPNHPAARRSPCPGAAPGWPQSPPPPVPASGRACCWPVACRRPTCFPAAAWARCSARVLKSVAGELASYPPPQGLLVLREQIAAHLAATRGLVADPGCIVVTAGTQQALRTAADLLLDPGDPVWVEDPGYIAGRGALLAAGAEIVPIPSDAEGIDVAAGERMAPYARMALVAPSHATPLGGALPIGRRLALLDWARRANAWVLEDDCDSEFRWEGKPLPPLATLDKAGHVIYCGTFSKTLAPALRIGFAVVPAPLVPAFVRLRTLTDRGTDAFTQAILAEFMRRGPAGPAYPADAHGVCAAAGRAAGGDGAVRRSGDAAGRAGRPAHGGCGCRMTRMRAAVVRACAARDLAVAPLRAYYAGTPRMNGLVIGFAATPVGIGERGREAAGGGDRGGRTGLRRSRRRQEGDILDEPIQSFHNVWDALEETPEEAASMTLRSGLMTAVETSWRVGKRPGSKLPSGWGLPNRG